MELTITILAITICLFVTSMFLLSIILEHHEVIDISWGIGILLSCVVAIGVNGTRGPLITLLLALVLVWGLRNSGRALLCYLKDTKQQDYQHHLPAVKGWSYLRTYVQLYLVRGLLMIVVAMPIINASLYGSNTELDQFAYVGLLFFIAGFLLESIGEYQFDGVRSTPKGKPKSMSSGLWRFVDHPDRIGELLIWWGIWLMVWPLPYSGFIVIAPICVTYLLLKDLGLELPRAYLSRLLKIGQLIPLRLH